MIFNGKKNKQERNRNNLEKEKKENIFKNIYKKYLKKICILTIITLIALFFSKEIFAIEFSEIMYNPIGNDAGREWIELYNPECENLENYFLLENNINHAIRPYSNGTSPNACDYVIICNNCENLILEYNITSRMYESSFTLSNTGEYLAIKINSTIIDEINYSDFMSEAMEGYSLTKYFETENTTWIQTDPSPGKYKTIIGNNYLNNNTLMNINDTNETYNNTPHNNTNINDTEIIIINNNEQGCNVSIGIKLKDNKTIYYNKEQIKFYNTLDITPNKNSEFYIEYWVEDIYGNILKNKVQTNNLNEKSYTPNINEKTAGIIFRNKLLNISCNGTEKILNDESEKIILIKNPEWKEKECEKCEKCDLQAYEETSKLKIYIEKDVLTLDAYRGNDRKYVINIGIKNEKNKYVLKQKIMLEKYSETSIEIPLDFKECGNYSIKIEGLGFKDEKEYIVDCKEKIDVDSVVNYKSLSDSMKKYIDDNNNNLTIFNPNNRLENYSQYFEQHNNDLYKESNFSIYSIINSNMIKNNNENKKPNISINNPINKSINYITGNTISGDTKTKIDTTKGILYESKNERLKKYSLIGIIIIIATTIIYFSYIIIFKNTSKDL